MHAVHTHTYRVGPVYVSRVDGLQRFSEGLVVLFVQNALRLVLFIQRLLNKSQLVAVAAASGGISTHQCRCYSHP